MFYKSYFRSVFIFVLICSSLVYSNGALKFFDKANDLYEQQNFKKAKEFYKKTLNENVVDINLYYNYANCLYRLNKLGEAILYYEKALKLEPNNENVIYNLNFVRQKMKNKNLVTSDIFFVKWIKSAHYSYNINFGLWFSFIIFLVLLISIAMGFTLAKSNFLFRYISIFLFSSFVILFSSSLIRVYEYKNSSFAIVTVDKINIYSGPGENYESLATIYEGIKFEIISEFNNWVEIKLSNGKGGFVQTQYISFI